MTRSPRIFASRSVALALGASLVVACGGSTEDGGGTSGGSAGTSASGGTGGSGGTTGGTGSTSGSGGATGGAGGATTSHCDGLDFCSCYVLSSCRPLSDGCLCSCDYSCPGEPPCDCDCGGGAYLGCAPVR